MMPQTGAVAAPPGVTAALAVRALACRDEPFDAAIVEHAKQALLDLIGCAVRARFESATSAAVERALGALGAGGICTGIGYGPMFAPQYAALVNGCNFHVLDFDDTHERASLHPGAPVAAAALAEAERLHSGGMPLIAAIVAGYDVAVRIGLALNPMAHYARGFHPTATAGVFGATAAAALLHGDDAETLASAFGINLSQAAGSLQFAVDGAATKPVQVGFAAHDAVLAREFAASGIRGPAAALEGRSGLLHAYTDDADAAELLDRWDGVHEIGRTAFKPYPCCRYMHAAIDALAAIVREHRLDPARVERIRVALPAAGLRLCAYPEEQKRAPRSIVDAQFSMYYTAAAALAWGSVRWDDFARRADPRLAVLIERVTVEEDPAVEALVPAMAALVEVDAGGVHERRLARAPRGEPDTPLEWPELIEKFDALSAIAYEPSRRRRIVEFVRRLDALDDIRILTAELGP
ncbi:2-methylcitrate dehydratase [Vulcanimicrobium alpinum]|uniref:2-methylcitrate dehydratase n=2 Tax=Vulcanimicrobium alpinum TaxID=3016050 RepID=A0AAN1Y012_UNVUL|nr:2-methylcitrate dehydratase [Vulcanimicrobium alpinum]